LVFTYAFVGQAGDVGRNCLGDFTLPEGSPSYGQDQKSWFLSANPVGTVPLQLDEEAREIEVKIRASEHRDSLELITKWAVRPDDLLQSLNQHKPHVVHFSGHGNPTDEMSCSTKWANPNP
jgi:hypothetical protein